MVRDQQKDFCEYQRNSEPKTTFRQAALGAQILKVALDYDMLIRQGKNHDQVIQHMTKYIRKYNPVVVQALGLQAILSNEYIAEKIRIKDATMGMIANQDIYAKDGTLVIARNQEFTLPVLERLLLMARTVGVLEPFQVLMPESQKQAGLTESPQSP